jgi:DHA1 family tetracycline resistance protein-like MFS transporter
MLLASFFIAQFVAAPFIGKLSDRFGRIPVLIISQLGTVLSFIMLGFAGGVVMLFAARILDGITGGNVIVVQAYITDVSPRAKRTQSLSLVWMAFGLGYILGPAIGGFVAAAFSEQASFMLGAAISLLSLVMTWALLDETLTAERRALLKTVKKASLKVRDILANVPLSLILLIAFGTQFGLSLLTSMITLFGEDVIFAKQTPEAVNVGVGILLTCIGVGQFLTQLVLIKPAVQRFGERRLVVIGLTLRGVSMLIFVLLASPFLSGFALLLFAGAQGWDAVAAIDGDRLGRGRNRAVRSWDHQSAISLGSSPGRRWRYFYGIAPALPFLIGGVIMFIMLLPGVVLNRRLGPVAVLRQSQEQPSSATV